MALLKRNRHIPWIVGLYFLVGVAQADVGCTTGSPATTPNGDFAEGGNGTVQHIPTGLIWKRCSEGQSWSAVAGSCTGTPGGYSWEQAFARVKVVNASNSGTENAGQNDWRLPNINELQSIVEIACGGPSINSAQFPATPQSEYYWSSSPVAGVSGHAHHVDFWDGHSFWGDRSGSTSKLRLVRAGQPYDYFDDANAAPVAASLVSTGAAQVGQTLAGSYMYSDADNDPQDTSMTGSSYRFVSSADSSAITGADNTNVASGSTNGSSNISYVIQSADQGKYLFYCVTPRASSGRSPGGETCSSATQMVTGAVAPTAPVLISIHAGAGSAVISFTAANANGGTPVAGYSATCAAAGQSTRSATGAGSPITVRNLTGGVLYQCTVLATNTAGLSTGASVSLPVTPAPGRQGGISGILMLLLD